MFYLAYSVLFFYAIDYLVRMLHFFELIGLKQALVDLFTKLYLFMHH